MCSLFDAFLDLRARCVRGTLKFSTLWRSMNLPIWLARNIKFLVCQFSVINISFLIGPTPEELAEMERIETEKRVGVFSLFFFF